MALVSTEEQQWDIVSKTVTDTDMQSKANTEVLNRVPLSKRIRILRGELSLSQKQFAEKTGICSKTVSDLELGRTQVPCASTLHKLAKVFRCPVNFLIACDSAPARPIKSVPENHKQVGAHIRMLRRALGLSAEQVAVGAGISHSTVHGVESGKRVVTQATVEKIASVFECTVECILDGVVLDSKEIKVAQSKPEVVYKHKKEIQVKEEPWLILRAELEQRCKLLQAALASKDAVISSLIGELKSRETYI